MRIAQCSDSFLPVVDGVGRVVYQYARLLAQAGNECYVITPMQSTGYRGGFPFEIIDFLSVRMPKAPQYRSGIAFLDIHYMERISSLEVDLIHVHAPGFAGAEAIRLSERFNVPLVGTFHSKYYDDFLRVTHSDVLATLGSQFVADFYELCDEVWTVSQDAAETLRAYGYEGELSIVQNGTEARTPNPEYEKLARLAFNLGDEPALLFVGQIDYKKNLRRVIDAAALLKKRGRTFKIVFAGQGQDREALEEYAQNQGLEILFTGHLQDRNTLDGLYMAATLFVFPSLYDTAGLVVREAAAMGTASVVVKNTAPAEVIVDGVNGWLCDDDPVSLCDVIEHHCYELSEIQRDEMGKHAQQSIPMAWEKVMLEVTARYQALIARGKTRKQPTFSQKRIRNRVISEWNRATKGRKWIP